MRLKSCSSSHIDVIVYSGSGVSLWRVTGFYDQPNAGKRHFMEVVGFIEKTM